jgi:hypothetical protein
MPTECLTVPLTVSSLHASLHPHAAVGADAKDHREVESQQEERALHLEDVR